MALTGYLTTFNASPGGGGGGGSYLDSVLGTIENLYAGYRQDRAVQTYAGAQPTYDTWQAPAPTSGAVPSVWVKAGVVIGLAGLLIAVFKLAK